MRCDICKKLISEDDSVSCADCGRRCCEDCTTVEYRNFSYYNGNVDIVSVCGVCGGYIPVDDSRFERCRK
jgi:hypothetical protein